MREKFDNASNALKPPSIDLEKPAGYKVMVTESKVSGYGDDLALSVEISIMRPNDEAPAVAVKASIIKEALHKKLLSRQPSAHPTVTLNHIKIANLDALVKAGDVSGSNE